MLTQKSSGQNLITVVEEQVYLNNTSTSITASINSCISSFSMQFENLIYKGVSADNYLDVYDGKGANYLYLTQYPINSISALQYRLTPTSSWVDFYTGGNTANIQVCNFGKIVLYDNYFPVGINNIRVVYNAGYTTIPDDIKQLCKEEVCKKLLESNINDGDGNVIGKGYLGLKSIGNGNENYTFDLSDDRVMNVVKNYKNPSI